MKIIDFSKFKVSCENCTLHELCLPDGLEQPELQKLEDIVARTLPLHKGDVLFSSGDRFSNLFAVRTGCIKLTIYSDDGEEQIIGFYLPGEIIGLDGIETDAHTCTATALDTSSICTIPFDSLSSICKQIPALNERIYRIMGRELSHENRLLLTITTLNADGRVATFLLSLSVRFSRLGYSANEFRLAMSRSEIGNYLGLSFETVSRSLHKFQKQGLITINHKYITILDSEALKQVCTEMEPPKSIKKSVS
jgi:CRP/FNR family transcriptional regulator, anaerobic regulatory protein